MSTSKTANVEKSILQSSIFHPNDNDHLPNFFAASGVAPGIRFVKGRLVDSRGTVIAEEDAAIQAPNWVILFGWDNPLQLDPKENYTFELVAKLTESTLASKGNLKPKGLGVAYITWPPSGTQNIIDQNFVPYGTYDSSDSNAVTTQMTNQPPVNATMNNGNWYAQYTALSSGTYDLTVTQDGTPATSTGLGLIDPPPNPGT